MRSSVRIGMEDAPEGSARLSIIADAPDGAGAARTLTGCRVRTGGGSMRPESAHELAERADGGSAQHAAGNHQRGHDEHGKGNRHGGITMIPTDRPSSILRTFPKDMADITLLSPGRINGFDTRNRMFMAPMTRSRALPGGVPSPLAIDYYAQRASAGLIITEGVAPSAGGLGYARTPAIETAEQVAAWKMITDAVHAKGGRIFVQFMHVGRIGHAANRYVRDPLVAPSAVRAAGQMWTDASGLQDLDMPRALETSEIPGVIAQYAQATTNALAAGFDGVELHSASGYLPMQFLSTGTNKRTDGYGGSVTNRIRFVVEALEAMAGAAGTPSKIGIKISPAMPFNDCQDDDPMDTYTHLVRAISPMGLAYLHVLRTVIPTTFDVLRPLFAGPFAAGGAFTRESGDAALASGAADFIVFGKLFTSNPDLPLRFANTAPLVQPDPSTFYSPGEKGYTDFPPL
jgi:N-ethylmaleimide reductase